MYIYDLYDLAVKFFNGFMKLMDFMFTPLEILEPLGVNVAPIYFFSVGILTTFLVVAIVKWGVSVS